MCLTEIEKNRTCKVNFNFCCVFIELTQGEEDITTKFPENYRTNIMPETISLH